MNRSHDRKPPCRRTARRQRVRPRLPGLISRKRVHRAGTAALGRRQNDNRRQGGEDQQIADSQAGARLDPMRAGWIQALPPGLVRHGTNLPHARGAVIHDDLIGPEGIQTRTIKGAIVKTA